MAEIFPNSITADICDLDELKTDRRLEGVFGARLAFARKTGTAAVPHIVGIGLGISGFDEDLGTQPEEVLTCMRLVTIVIPVLFFALFGLLFSGSLTGGASNDKVLRN